MGEVGRGHRGTSVDLVEWGSLRKAVEPREGHHMVDSGVDTTVLVVEDCRLGKS